MAPWLVLLLCLVTGFSWFYAKTDAKLDASGDDGYLAASELTTVRGVLANLRTFGYPQFLRAVRAVTGSLEALPYLQAGLYLFAVAFFFVSLRRFGVPAWTALWAAVPAIVNPIFLSQSHRVLTDVLGLAAVLAVASTLLLALARRSWRSWATVAVAVFVAYQIRPVYVCLIPVAIALAFLLRRPGEGVGSWRSGARPALLTAAVSIVPFLLFCSLRWLLVGHFGLVSFTGHNLIGIAGSLLSPATIERVPAEWQPLARVIHAGRVERGLEPLVGRPFPHQKARFRQWYLQYNKNVWQVGSRAAHEDAYVAFSKAHPRPKRSKKMSAEERRREIERWWQERYLWGQVEADRRLLRLSMVLLWQYPGRYRGWIFYGLREGPTWAWKHTFWLRGAFVTLGLSGLVFTLSAALRRRRDTLAALRCAVDNALPVVSLAVLFFLCKLALVVTLGIPTGRYIHAAILFVPGAAFALCWELLRATVVTAGARSSEVG